MVRSLVVPSSLGGLEEKLLQELDMWTRAALVLVGKKTGIETGTI